MSEAVASPATPPADTAQPQGFDSLAALRLAHQQMLERQASSEFGPAGDIPPEEIAAFLARAVATGATLADAEERRAAQRILDYWSADLVAASRAAPVEAGPVQLALHVPPAPAEGENRGIFQRPEDARQYIRLSALARQWRDSGAAGYLLSGEALREAERFERDPDVAALIHASREAQAQTQRRWQRIKNALLAAMVLVILALSGLTWVSIQQRRLAETALAVAVEQTAEASAQELAAHEEARAAADALAESQRLRETLEETNRATLARLAEQEARQRALDAALDILARQLRTGALDPGDLPNDTLRNLLLARVAPAVPAAQFLPQALPVPGPPIASDAGPAAVETRPPSVAGDLPLAMAPLPGEPAAVAAEPPLTAAEVPVPLPPPDEPASAGAEPQPLGDGTAAVMPPDTDLPAASIPASPFAPRDAIGYDPAFLGVALPLPSLDPAQAEAAWNDGAPVPYYNFSLILDARRRLAILSAANLDRVRSRALPSTAARFAPDPRIPAEVQPAPAFFDRPGAARALLVAPWDIAWGDALPYDTAEAAAFIGQVASLYPNLVPQQEAVNRGAWAAVQEWVRLRHNPAASRVTILSGPVFGDGADDAAAPVGFWKIAVSAQPALSKDPAQAPLAVDAFLVPNDPGAAPDPERHRVTVDRIAARTGLRFPPAMAAASRPRPGEALAARVPDLDAPDPDTRKQLVQDMLDLLRSQTAAGADQRAAVEGLLRALDLGTLARMSPSGRVNLLFLLAQVPAATWDQQAWLPLKAEARRKVARLALELGPQARGNLDALRQHIGLTAPFPQTVYVQFAGLTRDSVAAISEQLQALGWRIPGEERIATAAGLNQVRYHAGNAEDEAAARTLAADLAAAGQAGVEAVPMEVIRPGVLEIWISR